MNRALLICGFVLALAFPAAAGAKGGTHVAIASWSVETVDGKHHNAKANTTFRACESNPVVAIDARGKVTGAVSGKGFKEIWSVKGKVDSTFAVAWSKSGSFTDFFGIGAGAGGLTTGRWKLKIVQSGKTIGKSAITIATKSGC